MRIWLFSDLHMSSYGAIERVLPSIPPADLCIAAGDIVDGEPEAAVAILSDYIGIHMPVALVLGNHEFYSRSRSMQRARELAGRAAVRTGGRVQVLDDMALTVGGVKILGSTLWSDFDVMGDGGSVARKKAMTAATSSINDFKIIRAGDTSTAIWTPSMAREQHKRSLAWLKTELASSDCPTVVVSHHGPLRGSIAPKFTDDPVTAAFVSDLSGLVTRYRPAAWLHGHTHASFDYSLNSTRVVCNPRGYGAENAQGFNPGLVLDV